MPSDTSHRRAIRLLPTLLLAIMVAVAIVMELTVLSPRVAEHPMSLVQFWWTTAPVALLLALPWLPRRGG